MNAMAWKEDQLKRGITFGICILLVFNSLVFAEELDESARAVRKQVREDSIRLEIKAECVIVGPPADNQQKEIRGYGKNEVSSLAERTKAGLLNRLSGGDLAGMRSYVSQFFPKASSIPSVPLSGGRLLDVEGVNKYFGDVAYFLYKLESLKISLNLAVESKPTRALFRIAATGGGQPRETHTNSAVANLYRGYYVYEIIKDGFKPIKAPLNLVDEEGTTLDCILSPINQPDGPYPCKMK